MIAQVLNLPAAKAGGNTRLLELLKAAADELRLSILHVLKEDAFSVQELCELFEVRQSAMSHHLKLLSAAGLVITRREGNCIYYRRHTGDQTASSAEQELQTALLLCANNYVPDSGVSERLQALYQQRSEHSQQFFARFSDNFQQQQEQIAPYSVYGPATADMLAAHSQNRGLALEVGPGEGDFLEQLAAQFDAVLGLDTSTEMLALARERLPAAVEKKITLQQGSIFDAPLEQAGFDAIVVNMVLHHLPSPAAIFQVAARLLRPGGILSITELCSHDQSWARESCGDLWLGIDPGDLTRWAEAAGLSAGADAYLTQRNGFRIQVRHFNQPDR